MCSVQVVCLSGTARRGAERSHICTCQQRTEFLCHQDIFGARVPSYVLHQNGCDARAICPQERLNFSLWLTNGISMFDLPTDYYYY